MSEGPVITEQDKAEAACVSARGSGHQFELQLGHLCNNRCVFCSSGQLTELRIARTISIDPMLEALNKARAEGATRVTFLGGEPTLHKGFPDAVKHAVELGFDEIVIFTNGVMLPHPGFVERIVALGNFEWRISIQGGNEAAHVAVTKRKDSFSRIVRGMELLRAHGQRITANMCVNEQSYRSLPDYVDLVEAHGLAQLHVDIVRPASTGERSLEYLQDIMPRYSLMAPYMDRMMSGFAQRLPDFDVNLGNLPLCILPQWAHRIQHGGEQTVTVSAGPEELEDGVNKYQWHASTRRHLERCEPCVFRPRCTGIFRTYLDIYGDEEFQPISREQLLTSNQDGRHFVTLNAPSFASFREEAENASPKNWTLASWRQDDHQLRFDLSFRHENEAQAVFAFCHPQNGAGVVESEAQDFEVPEVGVQESDGRKFKALESGTSNESQAPRSQALESSPLESSPLESTTTPIPQAHQSPSAEVDGVSVLRGETFQGFLKAEPALTAEEVLSLVSWVGEKLGARVEAEEFLQQHHQLRRDHLRLLKVQELAREVAGLAGLGEWKVTGVEHQALRSVVSFARADEAGVEVVLAAKNQAGRMRIGVDARVRRGAVPSDARELVREISRQLGG